MCPYPYHVLPISLCVSVSIDGQTENETLTEMGKLLAIQVCTYEAVFFRGVGSGFRRPLDGCDVYIINLLNVTTCAVL